ncbi:MAG: hypothetical protein M1819_000024 [Sarea resinae]|nr:MAG: hypothetical protein M1819_000024 [Sarea resinae]
MPSRRHTQLPFYDVFGIWPRPKRSVERVIADYKSKRSSQSAGAAAVEPPNPEPKSEEPKVEEPKPEEPKAEEPEVRQSGAQMPEEAPGADSSKADMLGLAQMMMMPEGKEPDPEKKDAGSEWTAEQDAELVELKKTMPWKQIAHKLGKPVGEIKKHWNILNAKAKEKEEKETPSSSEAAKTETPKEEKQKDERKKKEESKKGEAQREVKSERVVVFADERFSSQEMQLLLRLANRYDDGKWLAVASSFYDKTGRRVTPDEVHQRMDELFFA